MDNSSSISTELATSERLTFKKTTIRICFIIVTLLFVTGGIYLIKKQRPQEKTEIVSANSDGSVKQVEDYIRQNLLSDPDSFTPVHWSKLQKTNVFGTISYKIGIIYKAKNNKGEVVMNSKIFELDEKGMVLFVMDAGPMNLK